MNLSLCGTSTDINVNVVSCTDITHGNKLKVKIILRRKKKLLEGHALHYMFSECVMTRAEVFYFILVWRVNKRLSYHEYDFIYFETNI